MIQAQVRRSVQENLYLANATVEIYKEQTMDAFIHQLYAFTVEGKPMVEREWTTEVTLVPTSWWEHFKRDVMPEWFQKRFPVGLKEVRTEEVHKYTNCCPHIKVEPNKQHVTFLLGDPKVEYLKRTEGEDENN